MSRDDDNATVQCGSCYQGEHMCGNDCDCVPCYRARAFGEENLAMAPPEIVEASR